MKIIGIARLCALLSLLMSGAYSAVSTANPAQTPSSASPAASAEANRTRLILLGTAGGPNIWKKRSGPATLIVVDGRPYLFDAGEGTPHQLVKAGFIMNDVTRIFLTHLHFDHTADLASMVAYNWVHGGRRNMQVYGPPGTTDLTNLGLAYFALPATLYSAILPPHPEMRDTVQSFDLDIQGQQKVYEDDLVKIFAIQNTHFDAVPVEDQSYGRVRSYSYRVETPDRIIVITGDTGMSDAVTSLSKGADILVSEVSNTEQNVQAMREKFKGSDEQLERLLAHQTRQHINPADIGKIAQAAGVGMVVLTHIVPGADAEIDRSVYSRPISAIFHGPVFVGRDLDEY